MFTAKPIKGSRTDTEQEVEHLDAIARQSADRKQRVYNRLRAGEGSRVLDVGCGAGADTVPLGLRVGPSGRVVGLDVDAAVVAEADARAAAAGVGGWVEHRVADATEIPFPDGFFDACHSERVFMHLRHPDQVFAEMVRVVRPGGWLLLVDWDHATLSIDTPETGIERRISPFWASKQKNPCSGRRLLQLFRRHALEEVDFDVSAALIGDLRQARYFLKLDDLEARACQAGAVTEEEVGRFRASLEELEALNATYVVANQVTVGGRTPGG
jgi:ubiquinone/menaquinone biosynthesis C-methylase UbiE